MPFIFIVSGMIDKIIETKWLMIEWRRNDGRNRSESGEMEVKWRRKVFFVFLKFKNLSK